MISSAKLQLHRLVPKNAFARHVGVLAGGTAVAQALTILTAPIFSRLYSPEDFGLSAVFAALLGLVLVISTLSYELSIPLPESDQEAIGLVVLCIINVLAVALITLFLGIAFGSQISALLGAPELSGYLWLLAPAVLVGGGRIVLNYWASRTKRFPVIAASSVWQSLGSIIAKAVLFKAGAIGLIFSQVVGQGVGILRLIRLLSPSTELSQLRWHSIWFLALRYRRFPIYSTGAGLLNVAGAQAPPLLFVATFGPAAAGFFALASAILQAPLSFISSAIGQVFFATASESLRSGTLGRQVEDLHRKLSQIALPPALLLAFTAPDLFALVFGSDWRPAGDFARFMAPWIYFAFVSSPLSSVFFVFEKQSAALAFHFVMLTARMGAILTGVWLNSLGIAILLFSVASATSYLGLLIWVYYLVKIPIHTVLKHTFTAFTASLICSLPVFIIMLFRIDTLVVWVLAMIVSIIAIFAHYFRMLRVVF